MQNDNSFKNKAWHSIDDDEWDCLKYNYNKHRHNTGQLYVMLHRAASEKMISQWCWDVDSITTKDKHPFDVDEQMVTWDEVKEDKRIELLYRLLRNANDDLTTDDTDYFIYRKFPGINPLSLVNNNLIDYEIVPPGHPLPRGNFGTSVGNLTYAAGLDWLVVQTEKFTRGIDVEHLRVDRLNFDEEALSHIGKDIIGASWRSKDDIESIPPVIAILASPHSGVTLKDSVSNFFEELDIALDEEKLSQDIKKLLDLCCINMAHFLLLPEMVITAPVLKMIKTMLQARLNSGDIANGAYPYFTICGSRHLRSPDKYNVNESTVLGPVGEELWVCRKIDPFTFKRGDRKEKENIVPGNRVTLVDIPFLGHRITNLICRDYFLFQNHFNAESDSVLPSMITVPAYNKSSQRFLDTSKLFFNSYRISSIVCNSLGCLHNNNTPLTDDPSILKGYSSGNWDLATSKWTKNGKPYQMIKINSSEIDKFEYFTEIALAIV